MVEIPAVDETALIDEAMKKTGMIWVGPSGGASRAVWHVWDGGSTYLLCGGGEQACPVEPGDTATVIVASKDKGVRIASYDATVERVGPGEEWDRITGQMTTKRLNLPDGESAPDRWARESTLLRLTRTGGLVEAPGRYDAASHAGPPLPSTAGTKVPRPWRLFGRKTRRP